MPIHKVLSHLLIEMSAIVNEINYARNELICGRQEEAYKVLTSLSDNLTKDIHSKGIKEIELTPVDKED